MAPGELFPFQKLAHANLEPNFVLDQMQPKDIDELSDEIAQALQRCSIPESQVSPYEQSVDKFITDCIWNIDCRLVKRAQRSMDSRDGALLLLFRKTLITPANLQALFRMCDPHIRTGPTRCHALWHLRLIGNITSSWSLWIPGDESGDSRPTVVATRFGMKQITVLCDALTHGGQFCEDVADPCLSCGRNAWHTLNSALTRAFTALPLEEVIILLDTYNWPQIFQNYPRYKDADGELIFLDEWIFGLLHGLAGKLLANDENNQRAKSFLQVQLGSCHALLHRSLNRIISGEIYASNVSSITGTYRRLDEILSTGSVLFQLIHCFVPVPVDEETMSLVRRARTALAAAYQIIVVSETENYSIEISDKNKRFQLQFVNNIMNKLDNWQDWHDQTDEVRWEKSLGCPPIGFCGRRRSVCQGIS